MNEMKSAKAHGLDGFPMQCLKKGGMAMLEWLVPLLNLSFDTGVVPMDWRGACIVPLYKVPIKRVRAGTECAIGRSNVGLGRVEDA